MRDRIEYKLTWKNEDTNRVSSKKFTGEDGKDHSAMDDALELAQEANGLGRRSTEQGPVVPDLRVKRALTLNQFTDRLFTL